MNLPATAREARLAEVIGAVAGEALRQRNKQRLALLDDGSPEAELAARLLVQMLGEAAVLRVQSEERVLESVLQALPHESEPMLELASGRQRDVRRMACEVGRLRARLLGDALPANSANKTALLLGGDLPPEPLLPLGDLFATEVRELTGSWSAPPEVVELARAAGGIENLDAALTEWLDRRASDGLDVLGEELSGAVRQAFERGRESRVHGVLVPKLGRRTLGLDLFV